MVDQYQQPNQNYGQGTGQYPQQQQGYPQPQQGYQQPQPAPQPPSHTKLIIGIAVALVVIVAAVFIIFGLDSGDDFEIQPTITEPSTSEPEIAQPMQLTEPAPVADENFRIEKFVFAKVINDDYTYTPKDVPDYFVWQTVYVYIEPEGYSVSQQGAVYVLDLVEDVEVKDASGNVIQYLSKEGVMHMTENPSEDVAIRLRLNFAQDAVLGEYTVEVTLKDLLSGKQASETGSFSLKE